MHRCRPCCACLCPPLSPLLRSLHPHLRLSPPASQFVCCPRLVRCCLRLRQFVWSPSPVALCPPHILIQPFVIRRVTTGLDCCKVLSPGLSDLYH
ncbi:hypothetical protein BDA96_08G014900 [Sorghum bicolor]|uniref:Uncharacterized protein n=1 Tax=Sorghum bicolor TaxID=4558 RepID=A0A921QG54_SORBI|nr:hypothetical protein BDA96_08G014900 [Sorghum bicolor]